MSIYAGIAVLCLIYAAAFYYLLATGDPTNSNGMFALGGFFGIFIFLGLGGLELLIYLFSKKQS